jgi:hypothetical protein
MTRGLPTEGHLLKSTACDVFCTFVQIIAAKLCVLFYFILFYFLVGQRIKLLGWNPEMVILIWMSFHGKL